MSCPCLCFECKYSKNCRKCAYKQEFCPKTTQESAPSVHPSLQKRSAPVSNRVDNRVDNDTYVSPYEVTVETPAAFDPYSYGISSGDPVPVGSVELGDDCVCDCFPCKYNRDCWGCEKNCHLKGK
eukprot:TRINITY_DN3542_c0_g1_i1.p1 TRINITY_DN3542_c0_g1~~TRINITY_DN3542_c0_g1_i1.p1  ORF type:complete len:125 (+),score=7.57 TRINITY_DN3542_c0_g1_i1:14-388(+)